MDSAVALTICSKAFELMFLADAYEAEDDAGADDWDLRMMTLMVSTVTFLSVLLNSGIMTGMRTVWV